MNLAPIGENFPASSSAFPLTLAKKLSYMDWKHSSRENCHFFVPIFEDMPQILTSDVHHNICTKNTILRKECSQHSLSAEILLHFALYWDSTETLLRLHWDSTETPLRLHWDSYETLLRLLWDSTETLLRLYWDSTETLLRIYWDSTETLLRLYWDFT